MVKKFSMIMDTTPEGLSAQDINGGELNIMGVIKEIVLTGDGKRKQVAFIVCDLPKSKEPVLNVEASIALGVLPEQFPEWDYTTGRHYKDGDIIQLFSSTESFASNFREEKEETEFD